jgi:tetratricopeptide (TPR) repeat protein
VHGLEGVGVSCLVSQFSRDNIDLLQGPLIWLVGRQPDGTAVPVGELLRLALRGLDVADVDQAASDAERAAMFQRVCRDKAFMLVVDDLVNTAQIRNLIPTTAPHAVIVATGQHDNRALRQEGFTPFAPEILTPTEARALFGYALGDNAGEIAASVRDELADHCGGFPLLLKVLAAQLADRTRLADRTLRALRASKLDVLSLDSEQRMVRFFDVTYANLSAEQQQTYRWLALLPSGTFTVEVVAAAVDAEPDDVVDIIEELVDFNLLTYDADNGRYGMHEVIRGDARARARAADDPATRDAAVRRVLTWYLREAIPQDAGLSGRWVVDGLLDLRAQWYGASLPTFSRSDIQNWFGVEMPNLVAAVRLAHKLGMHDLAWLMAIVVFKYLHQHRQHAYWLATHQDGLESAEMAGDRAAVMQLCLQLGAAHLDLGEYGEARRCFETALATAQELSHPYGLQSALEWIGKLDAAEGDTSSALAHFERSWNVVDTAGDQIASADKLRMRALLHMQKARAYLPTHDWSDAEDAAVEAKEHFVRTDEVDNQAKARVVLGRALLGAAQPERAAHELAEAVALFDQDGSRSTAADTRRRLAEAHIACGRTDAAVAVLRSALSYYVGVGNAAADDIRQQLRALGD